MGKKKVSGPRRGNEDTQSGAYLQPRHERSRCQQPMSQLLSSWLSFSKVVEILTLVLLLFFNGKCLRFGETSR